MRRGVRMTFRIAVGLAVGVLLILVEATYFHWDQAKDAFWKYSFIDCLGIGMTILVAYAIAYMVNEKLAYRAGRRQLLISHLDKMQEILKDLQTAAESYMNRSDKALETRILGLYTEANVKISFLLKLERKNAEGCQGLGSKSIATIIKKHKDALTGNQFRTRSPKYNEKTKERCRDLFCQVSHEIDECKFRLFE